MLFGQLKCWNKQDHRQNRSSLCVCCYCIAEAGVIWVVTSWGALAWCIFYKLLCNQPSVQLLAKPASELLCWSVVAKCEGACTAAKKLSHPSRIQLFCFMGGGNYFMFFGIKRGEYCRIGGRIFLGRLWYFGLFKKARFFAKNSL
jgi:hypothetical protein